MDSGSFLCQYANVWHLFGRMFRQGMHDLKVWPNVEADGSEPTKTPGRTSSTLAEDQMSRLAKVRDCLLCTEHDASLHHPAVVAQVGWRPLTLLLSILLELLQVFIGETSLKCGILGFSGKERQQIKNEIL